MSHKASPWEDGGCESWVKTLKYEEVFLQEYRNLAEARTCLERLINKIYNRQRLHSALGYRPPAEFEQALLAQKRVRSGRMSQFVIAALRRRSFGGSKGGLYRETLQATGFYVGRIVIATAEFAPMPPFVPGYPGGLIPIAIGMRFRRHHGIYQSDGGLFSNPNSSWTLPPVNVQTRTRERAGRIALSPIVLMRSDRLFLDRVARQQSPSPLHRRNQNNLIARSKGTIYQSKR